MRRALGGSQERLYQTECRKSLSLEAVSQWNDVILRSSCMSLDVCRFMTFSSYRPQVICHHANPNAAPDDSGRISAASVKRIDT